MQFFLVSVFVFVLFCFVLFKWADSDLTLEECETGFADGFDMGKRRERSLIT